VPFQCPQTPSPKWPAAHLKQSVTSIIYGDSDDSDDSATQAVDQLRSAGFERVTLLKGGLPAWKAIKGATEGRATVPGLFDEGEGASIIGQTATP